MLSLHGVCTISLRACSDQNRVTDAAKILICRVMYSTSICSPSTVWWFSKLQSDDTDHSCQSPETASGFRPVTYYCKSPQRKGTSGQSALIYTLFQGRCKRRKPTLITCCWVILVCHVQKRKALAHHHNVQAWVPPGGPHTTRA